MEEDSIKLKEWTDRIYIDADAFVMVTYASHSKLINILSGVFIAIITLIFLWSSMQDMRIRTLRLYGATIASGFGYILLDSIPGFSALILVELGQSENNGQDINVIKDFLALIMYFAASGFFVSSIQEIGYVEKFRYPQMNEFLNVVAGVLFSIIPSMLSSLILLIRFGVLPLLVVGIVTYDSWGRVSTILVQMIDILIVGSENILNEPWVHAIIRDIASLFQ